MGRCCKRHPQRWVLLLPWTLLLFLLCLTYMDLSWWQRGLSATASFFWGTSAEVGASVPSAGVPSSEVDTASAFTKSSSSVYNTYINAANAGDHATIKIPGKMVAPTDPVDFSSVTFVQSTSHPGDKTVVNVREDAPKVTDSAGTDPDGADGETGVDSRWLQLKEDTLSKLRRQLQRKTSEVTSSLSKSFTGEAVPMKDMTPVLIVSSWRSGSSFLGALVESHPLSMYFYEPMSGLVSDEGHGAEKVRFVQRLFRCRVKDVARQYSRFNVSNVVTRPGINVDLATACKRRAPQCRNLEFLSEACAMHPMRVIKVVRMRVRDVEPLLRGIPRLRVVLLVRDPRAVMHSRKSISWCHTTCASPASLCTWLTEGLRDAARYAREFPGRVLTVKHEHMASNVTAGAQELFSFLGLNVERRTLRFIQSHTAEINAKKDIMNIRRNSTRAAMEWRLTADWEQVKNLQQECGRDFSSSDAFEALGYRKFSDEAELRNLSVPLEVQ